MATPAYTWHDYPATTTPINEVQLNRIEQSLADSVRAADVRQIVVLTESAYDALATKDSSTMYCILPDPET